MREDESSSLEFSDPDMFERLAGDRKCWGEVSRELEPALNLRKWISREADD